MKAIIAGLTAMIAVTAAMQQMSAQQAPVLKAGDTTPADVALAVSRIPRLAPESFAALPPSAREALNLMACRVPQTSLTSGPANVVEGEFAAKGQRDWAALCSNGSASEIRIVWGGPVRCEDRVASLQDSDSMAPTAPGVVSFNRTIATASIGQIARYVTRLGAKVPEDPSHEAIEDGPPNTKLVHYCFAGRWQTLR